ncbi:ABC transporter [Hypoxylon sp. FL1284]|nr:ABC transporter [Hypoxylon sp. FL1284]
MSDDTPTATDDGAAKPDTKPPQRKPTISDYLRVFGYATKWDFCVYAVAAVASIGAGVAMPLMTVIFGQLVGQFTSYFGDASAAMSQEDFDRVLSQQALYIMGLFFARWGLSSINKFCFRMIGIRLSSAIRHHYLRSLLAQPIHAVDSMPAGAPATAITATSSTLQIGISDRLGTFLQFTATVIAAIIVAFIWSWSLTLVTSSLIIYILVVMAFALPTILKAMAGSAEADAQGTAIASEALQNNRLVMACGVQTRILSRYDRWVQDARNKAQKMAPVVGIQLGGVFFGMFGAFGLAFWYGMQRFIDGAIDNAGVVIVVLMSVMMILTSMERISTPLIAVSKAMVAACELFTVIDAPIPPTGTLKPEITGEDLVFTDVSFAYPSRPGVKVLDMLSFRIRHGQNTALVGSSGSGKSTIVAMLERWYSLKGSKTNRPNIENDQPDEDSKVPIEPESSGSITVGGHDLEELDLHWWRTQIGLVQQEPFLFNDTIFGNVANGLIGTEFADESEERKRELVQEACKEAYAHEFIDLLPEKYATRVGDGGVKLSGGQKQRIAIARSIIKKPRILILDEATSAIDVRGERIVQAALDKVSQGRTTITIAHRLSTIKKADHIVVLQKGRAVEEGTHSSLLANEAGVYSGLVKAQSLEMATNEEEQSDTLAEVYDTKSEKDLKADDMIAQPSPPQQPATPVSRSLVRTFPKLLYEQRVHWPLFLAALASSITTAAGTPIQAWLFAKCIETFLLQGDELKEQARFWGFMWFALAGGVGLSYSVLGWACLRAQYFVSAAYKMRYLTDLLYQKPHFFDEDSNSHGSLTSRIAGDAKLLEELFGINMVSWLSGVWTVIGCIIISLSFGWKLGLIALFITMPITLASGVWKYRHEVQFNQMNEAVFMESSQFATEAINAIRTVSSLTMEPTINSRYQKLLQGHVDTARRKAQWTAALYGFADSAGLGCQALVFWYGGRLLSTGEYTLEAFFVCYMAIIQGAEGAASVLANVPSATEAAIAANRIFDMQESADLDQGGASNSGCIPESDGGVQIELRDVYFKYPTRDVHVFQGLNLSIEKGSYAALVGPSGSGKSTVISLLEKFYEVESNQGTILCNGTDINDLDVYDYRQDLSLVAQEPTMFRGTIRDNILFGIADPDTIPEKRIHEVCRDAFIHDFIMSLPEGYDTDVGVKEISGGQKQRIAIARALIRNPKLLLLDEATSALDSESEKIVQAALEKARAGRTMIAVAHRLSTIQTADVIFVLDNGKVVEKGTHSDLVKKQGVYWEMCQSQALDQ